MIPAAPNTPLHVLLADDDGEDRFFFEKVLKEISADVRFTAVKDGEELMAYLIENSGSLPDILFLDLTMPRKSGTECLGEIKASKKLKGLRVVMFMVAFQHNLEFETSMKRTLSMLGADDFISKGNNLAEMKKGIQHALARVPARKQLLP